MFYNTKNGIYNAEVYNTNVIFNDHLFNDGSRVNRITQLKDLMLYFYSPVTEEWTFNIQESPLPDDVAAAKELTSHIGKMDSVMMHEGANIQFTARNKHAIFNKTIDLLKEAYKLGKYYGGRKNSTRRIRRPTTRRGRRKSTRRRRRKSTYSFSLPSSSQLPNFSL